MNEPTTDPINPYADLRQIDSVALPSARVEQRGELLTVDLADGARLKLSRNLTGAVQLQVDAQGQRVVLSLPAEVALRAGSHVAGLAAESLAPAEESAA